MWRICKRRSAGMEESFSSEHGLAYYLLISEDMREFALMTTDGSVIATSAAACQLYTSHISYDKGGHMTAYDTERISELG